MSIKTTHCGFTLALIKIIKDFVYIIALFYKGEERLLLSPHEF